MQLESVAIRCPAFVATAAHQACASGLSPQIGQSDASFAARSRHVFSPENETKALSRAESRQFWSRLHTPIAGFGPKFFPRIAQIRLSLVTWTCPLP